MLRTMVCQEENHSIHNSIIKSRGVVEDIILLDRKVRRGTYTSIEKCNLVEMIPTYFQDSVPFND